MNKIICIDSGVLIHRSIFAWGAEKKRLLEKDPIPASYTYLNTAYSILKKIGLEKDDTVIIAQDSRNSWRKSFLHAYKGQRKAMRDSHEHINWSLQYGMINKLESQLNESTNWHFLKLENMFNYADLCLTKEGKKFKLQEQKQDMSENYGIESDDIQSVIPKLFKDKEVVLVTIDKDLYQLYFYDNVRVFNPNLKSPTNKAKKGFYEIVDDPLKIITKKVRSGDTSDNIIVDKKTDTERDVEIRRLIINLLNLPKFVEQPIINVLKNLDYSKKIIYDKLPFQNSLAKKFDTIYDKSKMVTWEESFKNYLIKSIAKKEKNSVKTPEELYKKNEEYKKLVDKLEGLKKKRKEKVKV